MRQICDAAPTNPPLSTELALPAALSVPGCGPRTMLVSLSSRYRKMTSWQPALIRMVRAAGGAGGCGRGEKERCAASATALLPVKPCTQLQPGQRGPWHACMHARIRCAHPTGRASTCWTSRTQCRSAVIAGWGHQPGQQPAPPVGTTHKQQARTAAAHRTDHIDQSSALSAHLESQHVEHCRHGEGGRARMPH